MNAHEVILILEWSGWKLIREKGSHKHFRNDNYPSLITIPFHGSKDLHPAILNNIFKTIGLSLNDIKSNSKKSFKKNISKNSILRT